MKATSATPFTSPIAATAEGKPNATVLRLPCGPIREMRAVCPLVYEPTGGTTCLHCPAVEWVPPLPASAT